MVSVSVKITGGNIAEKVSKNIDSVIAKVERSVTAAMEMCRSMIEDQVRAQIAGSGQFGSRWAEGLHVTLDNMKISMSSDIPYADIFATGGTITGHPLLWLPIGDAERGGAMVSAKNTKRPYMLSVNDKKPVLFGVESVTIPKKWDLDGIAQNVMSNFAMYFSQAMNEG